MRNRSGIPFWPFTINRDSPQAQGILCWWPLIAANRDVLYDLVQRADGQAGSTMALAVDRQRGRVCYFPGSGGDETGSKFWDYYKLPKVPTLTTTHSFAFWFYNTKTSWSSLLSRVGWFGGSSAILMSNGKPSYYFSGAHHYANTASSYNVWNLLVITSLAGEVTFYLNGLPDGTTSGAQAWTPSRLGTDTYSGDCFIGYMSDVRIYNRCLAPSEIYSLYNPATRWDLYWCPQRRYYYGPEVAAAAIAWRMVGSGIINGKPNVIVGENTTHAGVL